MGSCPGIWKAVVPLMEMAKAGVSDQSRESSTYTWPSTVPDPVAWTVMVEPTTASPRK